MHRSLTRRSAASAIKQASTPAQHSFQRSILATAVAAAAVDQTYSFGGSGASGASGGDVLVRSRGAITTSGSHGH
ncbi:MAG: hypothetical protein AAGL66_05935, partial [Pseudomonadota bacterium]